VSLRHAGPDRALPVSDVNEVSTVAFTPQGVKNLGELHGRPCRGSVHDEFFQGATPVLADVDAASTYCYLLAVAEHRDADTGVIAPAHDQATVTRT
jgi:hypothetical protein